LQARSAAAIISNVNPPLFSPEALREPDVAKQGARVKRVRRRRIASLARSIYKHYALLLMVMAAGLAVPALMYSTVAANEASAQNSLRKLNAACVEYSLVYGGFPSTMSDLSPAKLANADAADLIEAVLSGGVKDGFKFTYTARGMDQAGHVLSYTIRAVPLTPDKTGKRSFLTDQAGTVRIE
jgi:hypothetical protein